MKATGIVRRIDSSVIMGAKAEGLETTGFSLILSHFPEPRAVKGGIEANRTSPASSGRSCFTAVWIFSAG